MAPVLAEIYLNSFHSAVQLLIPESIGGTLLTRRYVDDTIVLTNAPSLILAISSVCASEKSLVEGVDACYENRTFMSAVL